MRDAEDGARAGQTLGTALRGVGGISLAPGMGQDTEHREPTPKASKEDKAERGSLRSETEKRQVQSSAKGLEFWRLNPVCLDQDRAVPGSPGSPCSLLSCPLPWPPRGGSCLADRLSETDCTSHKENHILLSPHRYPTPVPCQAGADLFRTALLSQLLLAERSSMQGQSSPLYPSLTSEMLPGTGFFNGKSYSPELSFPKGKLFCSYRKIT